MVAFESMQRIPLFGSLKPAEIRLLSPLLFRRTYAAGESIFREGSAAGLVAILLEGLVSFRRRVAGNGEEACLFTVNEPGSVFGWSAIVGQSRLLPHTAVCIEETEVIEMDGRRLLAVCRQNPELGVRVLERLSGVLADRLHGMREQIGRRVVEPRITHG
jgi:CRP-like cAMP-binding protein